MNTFTLRASIVGFGLLGLTTVRVDAQAITPVDLGGLVLGAKIDGPVGPEVNASLVNSSVADQSLGDLVSSVSCPDGLGVCDPSSNPPGTIYTYIHTVTPGVDSANDGPFAQPATVAATNGVTEFRLAFSAQGFNGVAGYLFSDATTALGGADGLDIEQLADGSLLWTVSGSTSGWDTAQPISFFWQTTQPPSGPGGVYSISNGIVSGSGAGPLPTVVPEPSCLVVLTVLGGLLGRRRDRVFLPDAEGG